MLELVHLDDPSSETEVRALFPSAPTLRPADIFTSAALPGRMAALDIGICSPDACGAGEDCCDSMHNSKIKRYGQFLEGKSGPGFVYCPLIFSCYGRVHPETMAILNIISQGAARRRGLLDHRGLLARVLRNIGVAIWRRAASMVHDCALKFVSSDNTLLDGRNSRSVEPSVASDIARMVR